MHFPRTTTIAALICLTAAFVSGPFVPPLHSDNRSTRTISLYNIHTKEKLSIVYKRNGRFLSAAMTKINWLLRDWRRKVPTKMDPKLIDLAWEIHNELGSRRPIHVISGYRSPKTNKMLRRKRGGQARRSLHMLGKAMDVSFPDVPVRRMRYSALVREQGGVGYYPTSATPFVHIDTGRVRHWPRMRRDELALLFPSGRTYHRPARGGPITRKDVIKAQRRRPKLAKRVAAFWAFRANRKRRLRGGTAIASLTPPRTRSPRPKPAKRPALASLGSGWSQAAPRKEKRRPTPKLASLPQLARRPAPSPRPASRTTNPTPEERRRLAFLAWAANTQTRFEAGKADIREAAQAPIRNQDNKPDAMKLATLMPSAAPNSAVKPDPDPALRTNLIGSEADPGAWISAPAYDEEHPEELSYRPFPILPFVTASASMDDPALREMIAPDADRTLDLLYDEDGIGTPMQVRPASHAANLLWAQAFSGRAVALGALMQATREKRRRASDSIARRLVATSAGR